MSNIGVGAGILLWKGFHDVIERGVCVSAFACADDIGRRYAEEGDLHRPFCRDVADRDQSWRHDSVWAGPGDLESGPHLLRSLLRDHLGGDYRQTRAVASTAAGRRSMNLEDFFNIDSSDIRAAIEELREIQEEFEKQMDDC